MEQAKREIEHRWQDLGDFVREQRKLGDMSLRRLSELSGISNPYLSQIERGLRRPSADVLQHLARGGRVVQHHAGDEAVDLHRGRHEDEERDARVDREGRTAVQQREALAGEGEVDRQDAARRPVRRVPARTRVARDGLDPTLRERRHVEGGRSLGLVVEPDAGDDSIGSHGRG